MNEYLRYLLTKLSNRRIAILTILIAIGIAYLPIFWNGFAWDDKDTILGWPAKESWASIPSFLAGETPPAHPGNYRPVRNILYILTHKFFGLHPFGYHLQSLLLHSGIATLLYLLLRRLIPNPVTAWLATMLFALHPTRVEAITWITSSMDIYGVLFLMATLYMYQRAREQQSTAWLFYTASLCCSLLAFFTNEVTLSLPFLLILLEYFSVRTTDPVWKRCSRILPFVLTLGFYLWVRIFVIGEGARSSYVFGSFFVQVLLSLHAYLQYLIVLVAPIYLSINHDLGSGITSWAVEVSRVSGPVRSAILELSIFSIRPFVGFLFIVIPLIYAWKIRYRYPLLTFSILWFFGSFIPMSNLIPTEAIMVERFLYLPGMGFAIASALTIERYLPLLKKKYRYTPTQQGILTVVCLLLVFYGVRSYQRNQVWKNDTTLWQATNAVNKHAVLTRLYLAQSYLERQQTSRALQLYEEILTINPAYPGIRITAATLYESIGNHSRAVAILTGGDDTDQITADDLLLLGSSHMKMGKYTEAIDAYLQANILRPNDPSILNNLGSLYALQNDRQQAKKYFEAALAIEPSLSSAKQNLEMLLGQEHH